MRAIRITFMSLLIVLCTAIEVKGQDFIERLLESFVNYYDRGVDEKLYIQTDKPYYSAADTIWFKGYVVDAITHAPFDRTNFIYVELIDYEDKLLSRVKIQRDSTGFNGHIKIDPKSMDGEYTIRAYTKWMTNKDSEFLFNKVISIISPIPDGSMAGQAGQNSSWNTRYQQRVAERAAERAESKNEQMIKNYDLQFFPEGGALIAGVEQVVAFKALAEDGLSVEVMGSIYNSKNENIVNIQSEGSGLGSVLLTAEAGESYHAIITSQSEPTPKRFTLPTPDATAVGLRVSQMGDTLIYQPIASREELLEGLKIVVQTRGVVAAVDSVYVGSVHTFDKRQLFDGVSLLSVVNADMRVVAERALFRKPTQLPTVDIVSDKDNYPRRSKAEVSLHVAGSDGAPAQGQFAVSVTDNSVINRDSTKDNALSYLLLSSEIKGHVENPGLYFTEDSPLMDRGLELLMLTQGWRRYDLQSILSSELEEPQYPFEDYVRISGKVEGLFGGAAKKPTLRVMSLKPIFQGEYELTADNTFNLIGLEIPDSTVYIFQAEGRFGGSAVHLEVEPEMFPKVQSTTLSREREYAPFSFINQSRERFYNDGGLATIDIEGVVVSTERRDNVWGADPNFSTHSVGREKLEEIPGFRMRDYVRLLPGMSVVADSLYYRNNAVAVRFLINDLDGDYSSLYALNSDHVERIDFYFGNDALYFTENEGGVLCITLRPGVQMPTQLLTHVSHVVRLGYQDRVEFYQPKYETPAQIQSSKLDMRSTIFWSGDITPDSEGNMNFEFYTADKPTTYTVTVEGVTMNGEVCYGEYVINRK